MSTVAEPSVKAADIFSRILAVDLSTPRDLRLGPVGEKEHAVGVASDNLKRLYVLMEQSREEWHNKLEAMTAKGLEHLTKHLRTGITSREDCNCDDFRKEMAAATAETKALHRTSTILDEFFWSAAILNFPELMGKERVAVREGWQIVWVETEPFDLPEELSGFGASLKDIFADLATSFRGVRFEQE